MKLFVVLGLLFSFTGQVQAVQKAKIISPMVDIYSDADFDSEIIDSVKKGESYSISDKVSGPFFKIKLKSGKIGYIPDSEVYIEGKGLAVKGADQVGDDPFLQDLEDQNEMSEKAQKKKSKEREENEDDEEDMVLKGVTLQLINYHEDTLGDVQTDDLPALGYKSVSDLTWEVMLSVKTPKYYTDKLSANVKALNLWADFGLSNEVPLSSSWSARYGGGLFTRASLAHVEAPQKTYDMQEVTVGAYLEGSFMLSFHNMKYDLGMRYFFDRQSYGALALTLFF